MNDGLDEIPRPSRLHKDRIGPGQRKPLQLGRKDPHQQQPRQDRRDRGEHHGRRDRHFDQLGRPVPDHQCAQQIANEKRDDQRQDHQTKGPRQRIQDQSRDRRREGRCRQTEIKHKCAGNVFEVLHNQRLIDAHIGPELRQNLFRIGHSTRACRHPPQRDLCRVHRRQARDDPDDRRRDQDRQDQRQNAIDQIVTGDTSHVSLPLRLLCRASPRRASSA